MPVRRMPSHPRLNPSPSPCICRLTVYALPTHAWSHALQVILSSPCLELSLLSRMGASYFHERQRSFYQEAWT